MMDTAIDCGPPGKDNEWGAGRLDAYAAIDMADGQSSGVTKPDVPSSFSSVGILTERRKKDVYSLAVNDPYYPIAISLIMPDWAGSSHPDFNIKLYKPGGATAASTNSRKRQDDLAYNPASTGDYEIEIEPGGGVDDDCEGPDEIEPNDEVDLADWIDGYIIEGYACEGDDDWYVLDGQEGVNPEITLRYDEDECDIDLEVYSGDEYVGSLIDTESPDRDDFRVPDVCYILVYAFDGEGEYEIEIEP